MQVRVFEGENMISTLKKVKGELGPDALILSTRTVRKKKLGILGKPMTEITAAVETTSPKGLAGERRSTGRPSYSVHKQNLPPQDDITYDEIWQGADNSLSQAEKTPEHPAIPKESPTALIREIQELKSQLKATGFNSIQGELEDLKGLVLGLINNRSTRETDISSLNTTDRVATTGADSFGPLNTELARLGINGEAALAITKLAAEKLTPLQIHTRKILHDFLMTTIPGKVKVSGPILPDTAGPKKVALIGPTGAGKTTTIAKLAAAHLTNYSDKVALVTIDTYRIAAVEQLKVYGEIMGLPVEVVMAPEQLHEVFARHQDKELILIDTAGRSPKDSVNIKELAAFLNQDYGTENHLVLSATTREKELRDTVKRFGELLRLHSFIFTKIDECDSLGTLLNIPVGCDYPLSYLTNGQRVPEDLMLADPRKVASLIMMDSQQGNQTTNQD